MGFAGSFEKGFHRVLWFFDFLSMVLGLTGLFSWSFLGCLFAHGSLLRFCASRMFCFGFECFPFFLAGSRCGEVQRVHVNGPGGVCVSI